MTRIASRLALLTTVASIGYDWKMNGDGLATDDGGNPVWIGADAKEMSVKGDTVSSLQGEAKRHRLRAEAAEGKLTKYDGIDDPDAAKAALETVSKIDQKTLIDAGKVDEVRSEITKQYEGRITTAEQQRDAANQRADSTMLDSAFAASDFGRTRLTEAGLDLARSMFGSRFKVEDGKIVAKNANGETIYSDKHVGEVASFDEALEKTINTYKYKDTILKAQEQGGSGSGGGGGARGGGRTITRADFESRPAPQQAEIAGKIGTGEMSWAE